MKKIIAASLFLTSIFLSGCETAMTKPDSPRFVEGYNTKIEHYERINDRIVNLSFEKHEVDERFPWDEFIADVKKRLSEKGFKIEQSGSPVTIKVDKVKYVGRSNSTHSSPTSGMSVFNELGRGVVGAVAGTVIHATETSANKKDDDRLLIPIMDITILKADGSYKNSLQITGGGATTLYKQQSRQKSAQAVSEIFE